jgi:hypothetical protein
MLASFGKSKFSKVEKSTPSFKSNSHLVTKGQGKGLSLSRNYFQSKILSHEGLMPLTEFSEEEIMLRETVSKFAKEVVLPKVKDMDHKSYLDKDVLRGLFDQGLMGIELPAELGGTGE